MKTEISIIIPTLHRKISLIRLLNSIVPMKSNDIEIIIVEQGDNNEIEYSELAVKIGLRVTYIFTDQHNTARAKNIGVQAAKGKYLIFFDDDVILHKAVIKNLVKNFSDDSIGCVAGRCITIGQRIDETNNYTGRISPWATFSDGYSSVVRQDVDTPVGCNMAFPREIILKLGGFDTRFTAAIREESDLALRLKKIGYRIVFDPSSVVTHMREPIGGGRKTEGRLNWYYHFLSNETYFFLKHSNKIFFAMFIITRLNWILRCMFGIGREVSINSLTIPWRGIIYGINKYRSYIYEHRG